MENLLEVSASVVLYKGTIEDETKKGYYLNGRFMHEQSLDNVQATIQNSGKDFIFAIYDGMDREIPEKSISISIDRELKKIHDKIKTSDKDFTVKFNQFCERVDETNNLIYSVSLGNDREREKASSFAGLMICGKKAIVMNISHSKVYLLRNGDVKLLNAEEKKTERLVKMGILTHEQAEALTGRINGLNRQSASQGKKAEILDVREGDTFLLFTTGLEDNLSEDAIYELLSQNHEIDNICSKFLQRNIKNGSMAGIAVMAVKIERAVTEEVTHKEDDDGQWLKRKVKPVAAIRRSHEKLKENLVYVAISLLIVSVLAFAIYTAWEAMNSPASSNETAVQSSYEQTKVGTTPQATQVKNTPTPEVTESEASEPIKYKVQAGDSLFKISKKFYNDPDKYTVIMEANNITDPDKIKQGQILVIPKGQ